MDKEWKLYIHKNMVNGKVYIGVTSRQNPEHRWQHGHGYKENTHFHSAIEKYGWDAFEHIIVLDGLTEKEAKQLEKEYIARYDAMDPANGYNMTSGGDGTPDYHPSVETRAKLSVAKMRENLSDETLRRRSEGLKGRKFSESHKRKIGIANSKPIRMYNREGEFIREFSGANVAEREMNISHSHISQCCNNQRKTAGGYMWKFA